MIGSIAYSAQFFNKKLQLGQNQVSAIHSAIKSRGPNCNLLVFGCGYDSGYWMAVNNGGHTLFVEDSPTWSKQFKNLYPSANVINVKYHKLTVKSSLPASKKIASHLPIPGELKKRLWDVILIDAPAGYAADSPGRAAPISWAFQVADKTTHVFIDDAERMLESEYARILFSKNNADGPIDIRRNAKSDSKLIWYPGIDLSRYRIFLKDFNDNENLIKFARFSYANDIIVFDNFPDSIIKMTRQRIIRESSIVVLVLEDLDRENINKIEIFLNKFNNIDPRISVNNNIIIVCDNKKNHESIISQFGTVSCVVSPIARPDDKLNLKNERFSYLTESIKEKIKMLNADNPEQDIERDLFDRKEFLYSFTNGSPIDVRIVY